MRKKRIAPILRLDGQVRLGPFLEASGLDLVKEKYNIKTNTMCETLEPHDG